MPILPGLCKTNMLALKGLATEEELAQLLRFYQEYFNPDNDDGDGDGLAISPEANLSFDLQSIDEGDLGMEVERTLDPNTLACRLGFFKNNLPHQFLTRRHNAGVTAWEDPRVFSQSPAPDCLPPLELHWHQLAGIHSIIRNTLLSDGCNCMLICDDVGLGKTALTISTIAFLNQVMLLQQHARPLPPIFGECYLSISFD
jgi:TATA-binding protein-associated factor